MVREHRNAGDGPDRRSDSAALAHPTAARAADSTGAAGSDPQASRVVSVREGAAQTLTRVALLTEIPAPYRIPLFNALAERVDLRVLFLRERNPDRPYDLHREELHFEWRVLPGIQWTIRTHWFVFN